MNFTQEMRQALQRGQPVEITDTDTREVYVVLKQEQYRIGRKGSGVVFGEPAFHEVNRCPKTTPDPVAAPMQGYLN